MVILIILLTRYEAVHPTVVSEKKSFLIRDIHTFDKIPNSSYVDYHFCWQIHPCCMFKDPNCVIRK